MKKLVIISKSDKIRVAIISILVILAITAIVLHFAMFPFSILSFINSFFILVATCIFCIIIGIGIGTPDKPKKEYRFSTYEPEDNKFSVKKFFIGLGLFLACGLGYIPLTIFASNNLRKVNSSEYIKTQATVAGIYEVATDGDMPNFALKYLYYDENGNKYVSASQASWGGVTFKEGETVTVYYSKNNPEITINLSDSIMMLMGACLFFGAGLLLFFANIGWNKIMPVLFGLMFAIFAGGFLIGVKLASGLNFFLLFASGAAGYIMLLFFMLGLFMTIYGLISATKSVALNVRYNLGQRRTKKYFADLDKQAQDKSKNKTDNNLKSKTAVKNIDIDKSEVVMKQKDNKDSIAFAEGKKRKRYRLRCSWGVFKSSLGIIFGGLVFFVIGLCVMILFGIVPISKTASFIKSEATVIELHTYYSKEGKLMAYFDYEYFVDGNRYEKESSYSQSASIAPIKGDKITIYYNPNNPDEISDKNWTDWLVLFMGLIFACVGFGILCIPVYYSLEEVDSGKKLAQKNKNT